MSRNLVRKFEQQLNFGFLATLWQLFGTPVSNFQYFTSKIGIGLYNDTGV